MRFDETPEDFVRRFHADLTGWFSGDGDRQATWSGLKAACPADMRLVYPSGRLLSGAAFLESIADRYGRSPGFEAEVGEFERLHWVGDAAVVAYVERQVGARASASDNGRSALALLRRAEDGWAWAAIQETDLPGG